MKWIGAYGGRVHILSHGTNFSGGAAILFAAGLDVTIVYSTEPVKGSALLMRVEIEGFDISFINIYAPNLIGYFLWI